MKKSKIIIQVIAILFIQLICLMKLNAQALRWPLMPNQINFNASTIASSALLNANATPYVASNCATDKNGNILFWVRGRSNGNAIEVYNASGSLVGNLNALLYSCNTPNSNISFMQQEIAIVPVPGNCQQFYVIWFYANPMLVGVTLGYAKIDCSSSVVITQNSTAIDCFGDNTGSIAVTKTINGKRYLFAVAQGTLKRYAISSTGIGSGITVATSTQASGLNTYPYTELEVSSTANKILFGNSTTGKVYQLNLSYPPASTFISQTTYTMAGNPTVKGVEFNRDASRLFVCSANGLYWGVVNNLASNTLTAIASSSNYSNSQIELARDNYLYVGNSAGALGRISNNAIPTVASANLGITLNSNEYIPMSGQSNYRLPDQIDAEDYTNFCCPSNVIIGGIYDSYLTQSSNYIMNLSTLTIDPSKHVKLDAEPSNGSIVLNPDFVSEPVNGSFVAELLDGCGPMIPTIKTPVLSSITSCNSYVWPVNGMTYVASGTYEDTSSSFMNDYILQLTIDNSASAYQLENVSGSYTWPATGTTYTATGLYTATLMSSAGCDSILTLNLTTNNSSATTLNITCFIEGYMNGPNSMSPVLANQGIIAAPDACDTITIELHDANSPYNLLYTTQALLKQDGTASCSIGSGVISSAYYVVVKHRNAIQTWSAMPISLSSSSVNFNFTTAASQAYGSNQVEVSPGVWAFYSGDINGDENIDLADFAQLENDIANFIFGYANTDINGDGNVDILDTPVVEDNINNFIFSVHP